MEITLGELLLLNTATETLLHTGETRNLSRKMPFSVKHKLIKASDKFAKELGPYESERVALIQKYGEKIEEGKEAVKVKEENLEVFYKELGDVLATVVEMNLDFCMITDEDIDSIDGGDIELDDNIVRAFQKYMVKESK